MPDEKQPLASEMIREGRDHIKTLRVTVIFQWVLIVALIIGLIGTNVYHIYQWSQCDTVVVDSGDGDGNANYIQGDNTGGVYNNGTGSSETQEEWQQGDSN